MRVVSDTVHADEELLQTIENNKIKTRAMIEERNALPEPARDLFAPSTYWAKSCEAFEYLWSLPARHFLRLDVHLFHTNGYTPYVYYVYSNDKNEFRKQTGVDALCETIPPEYILNEPVGSVAFEFEDGRRLTHDTIRQQWIVNTLHRVGAFERLRQSSGPRKYILEIGAGYAGLAYHLSRILGNVTYIVLDLPETLLFSSSYLALHAKGKKVHLYDPSESGYGGLHGILKQNFDFILLPNYRIDLLRDLKYELVINVASMQEMRSDQVRAYLDFIHDTCVGLFYSFNKEWHQGNEELTGLTDMIRERFEIQEISTQTFSQQSRGLRSWLPDVVLRIVQRLLVKTGVRSEISPHARREYVCRPKLKVG